MKFNHLLLAIWVFLTLASQSWAQSQCTYCFCAKDLTCSSADCSAPAGCENATFTPPCSGNYYFESKVVCTGSTDHCALCQSCVTIFVNSTGQFVKEGHNTHCDNSECSYRQQVYLTGGTVYRMQVCKQTCQPYGLCTTCSATCTAYGCVWMNITTECAPLGQ